MDSLWIALVGGFMSGSAPLIVGWWINRRHGRIADDKGMWDLYQEVKAEVVKLEAEMKKTNRNFDALLQSVQAEPYDVANRILRRANIKQ